MLEENYHREGDKFPPLPFLASVAVAIGCSIVAIAGGGETSQLEKAATAPEEYFVTAPEIYKLVCEWKWKLAKQ